jgi:hypothetical protein
MTRRGSWGYALALAALSVVLARAFFVVPYLPTNDGPEHVIATYLEDHYSDPGTFYADVLTTAPEFAARGFTLLYGPLFDALGWRVGLQWALVLLALANAFGFVALVHAISPRRWPIVFFGFPLALTWDLYMGFFPFMVGSAVGLYILTLAVRWRAPSGLSRGLLAFLLLLQAVCHVFTAVLTGVALAALLVGRSLAVSRREALRELGRTALMGLPAGGILAASVIAGASLTHSPFSDTFLLLPASETLLVFPRLIAPGPHLRALLVVLAVLAAAVWSGRSALRRDADPTDVSLFVAGVFLLLVGALAPMNIPGWQFFSPRFLPLGVLLCLATVPVERVTVPWRRGALASAAVLLSGAWIAGNYNLHRRLARSVADAIRGLSAHVERHTVWLPITLAPEGGMTPYPEASEVPFLAPLRHMPMLYAVTDGGLSPYTFANNAATYPFVTRKGLGRVPPVPQTTKYAPLIESEAFTADTELRRRVLGELLTFGSRYEGILVTAARPDDLDLVRERGFVADWSQGSVFIGHFVPCTVDVTVPTGVDVPEVDVGVEAFAMIRGVHDVMLAPDGSKHIVIDKAPCGVAWVRPHWGADDDPKRLPRFCKNADADGMLRASLGRDVTDLVCEAPDRR